MTVWQLFYQLVTDDDADADADANDADADADADAGHLQMYRRPILHNGRLINMNRILRILGEE